MGAADPGLFALKNSLRAAIVVPLAFAISLELIESLQMALFAAFGAFAMLVFVDFGGPSRSRLRAYLWLCAFGVFAIPIGTLCSRTPWLATVAMALVAFAILFAGVLDDYIAAARAAATLAFVLPVMVPAADATIPARLAGWGLAGALSVSASLLLWPTRPRSRFLGDCAGICRTLAELVQARAREDEPVAQRLAAEAWKAITAVRARFVAIAIRPSGTAGPTAALARLIEDLADMHRIAARVPALGGEGTPCMLERGEVIAAAPAALIAIAARLEGGIDSSAADSARMHRAHEEFGAALLSYFEGVQADRDEAEATAEVDDAYRLRQLSYGTLQICEDARAASNDHAHGVSRGSRRMRLGATRRVARAHASTDSVWLRNSVRGALGLALAVLVGQLADLQHAFWIVLGTLSVLRSSALSTSVSIAWALLGTLAGIVIGGAIVLAVGGEQAVLWVVLPLSVLIASYANQRISFAAGQAAFSVVVLVLFNLLDPVGWKVGLVRVEDVAIGAAVSLLVGVLIWPRGAAAVLRRTLGAAYSSAARQLDATITALLGEGPAELREEATAEAFAAAQLLDAAIRDYLANRAAASVRLHDLTVLSTGAVRLRRVAGVLWNPNALVHLMPIDEDLSRLLSARDAFDRERHALCEWFDGLGAAIEREGIAPEPLSQPAIDPSEKADRLVVLEHAASGRGLQPGLAIAWAYRHLDALAELEPRLTAAHERLSEGERRGASALQPVPVPA